MKKLHDTDSRTHHLIKSKADLLEERKRASIRAKLRKDKVVKAMAEIRLTKKWDSAGKKLKGIAADDKPKKRKKKKKKKRRVSEDYDRMPRIPSAEADMMRKTREGKLRESDMEPTSYMSPYEMKEMPTKKGAPRKPESSYSHVPTFTGDDANLVTF